MKNIAWLILFFLPIHLVAQNIFVGLNTHFPIREFSFVVQSGHYELINKKNYAKITDINIGDSISFKISLGKIRIIQNEEPIGAYDSLKLSGKDSMPYFKLYITDPSLPAPRQYDDDLLLYPQGSQLFLINHVNVEKYVAGVVEAEGGSNVPDSVYYEVQATICRTWAMKNRTKHKKNGFNVCTTEHCQVYLGKCKDKNNIIIPSVKVTDGLVIIDKDDHLISATFHSNSGGETCNSEDVWRHPLSYLRSTVDTFSLPRSNAYWEVIMPKKEWIDYLKHYHHYPTFNAAMLDSALTFSQETRKVNFCNNIPLTDMRKNLKLRSTFFSVVTQGEYVYLCGQGYGHGVGLSQEGAMEMAKLGFSFIDIIKHYYQNTRVIPQGELKK